MYIKIRNINSTSNNSLREIIARKDDLFFFEGEKLVMDIIRIGESIRFLILNDEKRDTFKINDINAEEVWFVDEKVLRKMSSMKDPPEMIAIIETIPGRIDFINDALIFVLDNIQDPANMGTVFRCAAAFGISSIALTGNCVKLNNPKFLRGAQNSVFSVYSKYFKNLDMFINEALENEINIYLTSSYDQAKTIKTNEIKLPAAILIGNEGKGIDKEYFKNFETVRISQSDEIESLNAGVSACIIMNSLKEKFRLLGRN
ncbi:MAG: RNA methyltransferase [Acidobacteriota bacterium]